MADLYGSSYPVRLLPEPMSYMICDWMRHVGRGNYTMYELYPSFGLFMEGVPYYQVQ